jgi:hypothetical protein
LYRQAHPYQRVVEGLAAITAGRLQPTRVVDTSVFPDHQDDAFSLSFVSKGKTYKSTLGGEYPQDEPYIIADQTIGLANRALAASGAKGRFHEVFGTRQFDLAHVDASYVYLTPKQRAALERSNLLSFALDPADIEDEDEFAWANYAAEVRTTWVPFYTDAVPVEEHDSDAAATSPGRASKEVSSLDEALANPTAVEGLRLGGQGLQRLPDEIGSLTNLRWLYLQNNELTALPAAIGDLRHLEYINLDNNRLMTLPPEIGNLSALTKIVASRNAIHTLPPELGELGSLSELFLQGKNVLEFLTACCEARAANESAPSLLSPESSAT